MGVDERYAGPMDALRTLDDLRAWLDTLNPSDRVASCRLLADTKTSAMLGQIADETVYEATRTQRAQDVAEQFGLTPRQVQRAVANHNARARTAATLAA